MELKISRSGFTARDAEKLARKYMTLTPPLTINLSSFTITAEKMALEKRLVQNSFTFARLSGKG